MSKNKMDGLKKAEEKIVKDTHKPYEPTVENVQPTEIIPEAVVEIPKPEAPKANVVCPKCEKKNLLVTPEGNAYCTVCGQIGNAKEVAKVIADKKDAEAKLNAEWHMPPLPEMIGRNTANSGGRGIPDPLMDCLDSLVNYVGWLGKHFRREMNFVCKCGKEYSPKKGICPNCSPTTSLAIKR